MSITDLDQLTELQLVLQEDGSFSNGLWTPDEVIGYFNQRQYRFLKETLLTAAWATIPWAPGLPEQPLPDDWVATITAAWHAFTAGTSLVLPRSDQFEADHVRSPESAVTVGTPALYRDSDLRTLTLALSPAPAAAGEVDLIYVSLSEALDGLGVYFSIPDEFVPYLKYGVLADMLGKDGRGQDLLRSRYAEVRYQEGVALAESLLTGF